METSGKRHTYRLVLPKDSTGFEREIEFEEVSADAAVHLAQKVCGHRQPVKIFDGERLLGRLARTSAGFWVVSQCR